MVQALVTSAIDSASYARELGLDPNQIIISCKVSGVQDLISVYRALARRCDHRFEALLIDAEGLGRGIQPASGALGTEWKRRAQSLRATDFERACGVGEKGLCQQQTRGGADCG